MSQQMDRVSPLAPHMSQQMDRVSPLAPHMSQSNEPRDSIDAPTQSVVA